MTIIIQLLGNAGSVAVGGPYWLKSFDVDANDGRGTFRSTSDPAEALRFSDKESAFLAWRSQSTVRPLREDGEPNRPLTAFTVLFDDADDPQGL
jgi:hypothetical protein